MSAEPGTGSGGGGAAGWRPGDVVWVKLGSCWWPGGVVAPADLPADALRSLRKTPLAVVHFFQEDYYEFVRNENAIYPYNCSRKEEFIKKGLDMYRGKASHNMDKFPEDVIRAEELTGGDLEILTRSEYQQEKKESYAGLFGEAVTPRRAVRGRASKSRASPAAARAPAVRKTNTPSNYKAHILVQGSPSAPPPTPQPAAPSTPAAPASPATSAGAHVYTCHACAFSSSRLNVMVLHSKSHSGAAYSPHAAAPDVPRPRKRAAPAAVAPSATLSAVTPATHDHKRQRATFEIKNTLLADWEDAEEASEDPAPSELNREPTVKPPTTDTESALQAELDPDSALPSDLARASAPPPDVGRDPAPPAADPSPPAADHASPSCFDFREEDDVPEEALRRPARELARRDGADEDVAREVDALLEATAPPALPPPPPLKLQLNFPQDERTKSPDKQDPPPTKTIFKTKTFFRSRHSRSQDAIEKYVAEQLSAERHATDSPPPPPPPAKRTYAEHTPAFNGDSHDTAPRSNGDAPLLDSDAAADHPALAESGSGSEHLDHKEEKLLNLSDEVEFAKAHIEDDPMDTANLMECEEQSMAAPSEDSEPAQSAGDAGAVSERDLQGARALISLPERADCDNIHSLSAARSLVHMSTCDPSRPSDDDRDTLCLDTLGPDARGPDARGPDTHGPGVRSPDALDLDIRDTETHNLDIRAVTVDVSVDTATNTLDKMTENLVRPSVASDIPAVKEPACSDIAAPSVPSDSHSATSEVSVSPLIPRDNQSVKSDSSPGSSQASSCDPAPPPPRALPGNTLAVPSSKLMQILEERQTLKPVVKMSPEPTSPVKREKILNFNNTSPSGTPSRSHKQKIIIRRSVATNKQTFASSDLSRDIVLSRSSGVSTYTIEAADRRADTDAVVIHKARRSPAASAPAASAPAPPDDALFDINSMPIVLSEDLLSTESMDAMPVVVPKPVASAAPSLPPPPPIPRVVRPLPAKPVKTLEKSATPNILSKSTKVRNAKPMIIYDKATGDQKIIMNKVTTAAAKDIKISRPTTSTVASPGKLVLLPPGAPRPIRPHKIVIGKAPPAPDSAAPVPPGGTVMIITNAQGGQSRIVLSAENEKILFPNKTQPSPRAPRPATVALRPPGAAPRPPGVTARPPPPRVVSKQKPASAIITSKGQLIVGSTRPPRPPVPAPVAPVPAKDSVILFQQKSGTVMQLTQAQYQLLQRSGKIVHKTTPRLITKQLVRQITRPPAPRASAPRPPQAAPPAVPTNRSLVHEKITVTSAPAAPAPQSAPAHGPADLDNLEDLLPSTAIARPPAPAPASTADSAPAGPAVPDTQLLAVPGENFGGPPNTFYLCVEEGGTLTPIDNRPLVLDNNQLVPAEEAPRDILAAALANTDVFAAPAPPPSQQPPPPPAAPDFRDLNANVAVHCRVSETSVTLNQPIMTPLEVPSAAPVAAPPPAPRLDQLLGAPPRPPALPITVTDPRIARPATLPPSVPPPSMPLLSEDDEHDARL